VGYSDLTPFLLGLVERLGLVSFHGPLIAGDFARGLTSDEEESLLGALAGRYPTEQPFTSTLREGGNGGASGPLLGGCLSLLAATLGTPYFPDLEGSLVFWEDVNEPPYKVDRMLTHLGLSGNLGNIAGMIVGHLEGAEKPGGEPAEPAQWPALVASGLSGFSWPLAWGLESGHVAPNRTLPVGLPARLDTANGRLVLGLG